MNYLTKYCSEDRKDLIKFSTHGMKISILIYLLDYVIQVENGIKMLKFIQSLKGCILYNDIFIMIFNYLKFNTTNSKLLCFGGFPRDLILYYRAISTCSNNVHGDTNKFNEARRSIYGKLLKFSLARNCFNDIDLLTEIVSLL